MQNLLTVEQYAFIKYLTGLNTERHRGLLADMRRGLSGEPSSELRLYRIIARYIPEKDRDTKRESVYYLVAALYALHPIAMEAQGNFGHSMRQLVSQRVDQDAAERRFTVLLNARLENLSKPLRQAVAMLASSQQEIALNWFQFFADLLRWEHSDKRSQRAWANSFWAYEPPDEVPSKNQPAIN